MSKRHWILDAGHGGMVDGQYTTNPYYDENDPKTFHKMWVHDGTPIYEGVFNRLVVNQIATRLKEEGVSHQKLVGQLDTSLRWRKDEANYIYTKKPESVLVSVHGNAFNGLAKGIEVFTSKGETKSDPIAEVFCTEADKEFPSKAMRWDLSDGDKDKEANFYILSKTRLPAILTENFFFDNKDEAEFMMSEEGVRRIAEYHVQAILKIEKWT